MKEFFSDFIIPILHFGSENVLLLFLIFAITILVYRYIQNTRRLPPGPIGLPLLGYRPLLGGYPHKSLAKLSDKYGSIISLRLGPRLFVVANEYKVAKEVMSHPSSLDRAPEAFLHIDEIGFGTLNGAEWEEQRRFCIQSTRDLGLGRGRFIEMVQEEVLNFMEELSSFKGKPIELSSELAETVSNNVLSLLIGRRLENKAESDKIKLAVKFLDVAFNSTTAYPITSMVPFLRRVFEFLKISGLDRVAKTITDFSNLIKNEVTKHRTQSECKSAVDFINLYLEKMDSMSSQSRHYFSDDNLVGNVKLLFLAAGDTITTSILWLFRFMAAFPEVQKKVQNEIDEILGRDGKITYEERFKLPYTMAVLMESQRHSTVAPLPVRRAREDFEIQGYTIPKGADILCNMWALHHDPNYWVEPEKFNPERFLSEDKKKVLTNLPSFAPFSFGKRNCPGETVAWIEILNYFVFVMQRFNITAPPEVKVEIETTEGFISRPKRQPLCFVEREHHQ